MEIKFLVDEDFVNYKKPSMFIGFPYCTLKCNKDCGQEVCQNKALLSEPNIEIEVEEIIDRYLSNPLTHAIVCGGMEPFDSWPDLLILIHQFRRFSNDDVVIYTGYNKNEVAEKLMSLGFEENVIVKFGRYEPNQDPHFDNILGINLSSNNQYAEKIIID